MRLIITIGALLALGLARAGAQVPSTARTKDRVTVTARAAVAATKAPAVDRAADRRVLRSLAGTGGSARRAAERSLSPASAERRRVAAQQLRAARASAGSPPRRP